MGLVAFEDLDCLQALVTLVQYSSEPLVMTCAGRECLVAMSPEVLDRILFDVNLLNWENRFIEAY